MRMELERSATGLGKEIVLMFDISVHPPSRGNEDTCNGIFCPARFVRDNAIGEIRALYTHIHFLALEGTVYISVYATRGEEIQILEHSVFMFWLIAITATFSTASNIWTSQVGVFPDSSPLQDLF